MSRNYYSEIHLHFVWHTKESSPLLTPQVESHAHRELRHKIVNWRVRRTVLIHPSSRLV